MQSPAEQQPVEAMQVPLQLRPESHTQAEFVQVAPVWQSVLSQHAVLAMQPEPHFL